MSFTPTARRFGIVSAVATAVLLAAYAIILAVGLASLESPEEPIGDPFFSLMEILIIALMPAMIALMTALRAWVPPENRIAATISLVFMSLMAMVTSALHFTILTLSRRSGFSGEPWQPFVFSFRWPSVAYALDILAWDVFFALSMLFAASSVRGGRLAVAVRVSMLASGLLSLAGLSGVVTGDMQLRNIGIVGYVPVFLVLVVLLALLFSRSRPTPAQTGPAGRVVGPTAFQVDPGLIRWRLHLKSPVSKVYQAIATDEGRRAFWAQSAPEEGGVIHFVFPNGMAWEARILKAEPDRLFSIRYIGDSEASFSLHEDESGGTVLTLTDVGVPAERRTEVIAGWVSVLLSLKAWVDFGVDLRTHDPRRHWDNGFVEN